MSKASTVPKAALINPWPGWQVLALVLLCCGSWRLVAQEVVPDELQMPLALRIGNQDLDDVTRRQLAREWLTAVANGNQRQALRTAARLVDASASVPVDPYYLKIAGQRDLPASFFSGPYTHWDYQSWRHAWLIKQQAAKINKGTLSDIMVWFTSVCQTIVPEEKEPTFTYSAWPYWIMVRGWGVCDRMCWVLAEMLYQHGYETQIVYLMDSSQRTSSHTILEVRNAQGKVWVADPFSGILVPDYSIDRLSKDEAKLKEIWPTQLDWHEQIKYSIFFTPSFPQDYCWRNQELQKVLRAFLPEAFPRFGEDPRSRTVTYRELRQKELGEKLSFTMGLWFYPLQLLSNDMYYERKGL